MFIVELTYVKEMETVNAHLKEHLAFLRNYYGQAKFLLSGPRIPREGGVIIADVGSREELMSILGEDPFHREQIAEYRVIEFQPTMSDERLGAVVTL